MRVAGRTARFGTVALIALVIASCTGSDDDAADGEGSGDGGIGVEVVSSRPEYVSGGDALVAISLPDGTDASDVTVEAAGDDVTDAFAPDPDDDKRLVGLVEGLPEGDSDVSVEAGEQSASVTLTNHPDTGPLFAGEQVDLYACTTESFGLAASTPDEACAAPTVVTWQYVDEAGERHDLADPTAPPADAATVEVDGQQVPFVLRTENGTINRAVYTDHRPRPRTRPDR